MKALLLSDSDAALDRACAGCGVTVVRARSVAEGRSLLARSASAFAVVDARIAAPRPLDDEIRHRLEAFFERLRDHRASGLYDAVMRAVERPLIAGALERARGVRGAAALTLGIDRGTLSRRIRALGLDEEPGR